ncbi:TonB-dependent receptor [Pseudoalteromonas porphyrae]|uniref:TonB-dependent receptor n=2 Tax=Pseudoalteromonas TaxID=53246 RepID=A0A0N1MR18_9GAMM|nr:MULTISPECIES: TonB-dependent receptor [Pseudoalteromonas]KPH56764.1 TonB-dependent receptor [Pseudoalteromonas porphyrae]KPH92980.1 TonB-dependent receptor [Pseudoalteromonas porphyrae]
MKSRPLYLASLISTLLTSTTLLADDVTAENMEVMIVTASGYEQKLIDAPASVSVVSREDLQNKPFTSLADALRDIEGIDVGAGQDKNGNISITMRGLPASYTLVLIDGRRQSDVGNIGPNNFGNSQFMYMPPLEAIDRIEVVRGPMSTLYGADAIGGVINIITRKNLDSTHGSVTVSSNIQTDDQYGDDNKIDLYLTGPTGVEGLTYGVRGSFYDRQESKPTYSENLPLPDGSMWVDDGSFGDKKVVAARNFNAGLSVNYQIDKQNDITFEYDIAKQRYDNTQGQTGTLDSPNSLWRIRKGIVHPRVGYTPYQRVEREQFVLAHVGRYDAGTLTSSITRSSSENFGRSLPLNVQERLGVQAIWDKAVQDQGTDKPTLTDEIYTQLDETFLPRPLRALKLDNLIINTKFESNIDNHYFVIGAQYFDAEMEDGVFGMYGDAYKAGTTQDHRQTAVFAEDNWEITSNLTATLGARYDHHNIFGSQVSPRAYLAYSPADEWTFKGGISTGYKTPEPNQLFPGITGFGGQGTIPFVGTPDLQPETSVNYEVAAYFNGMDSFSGNITVFYNDFNDKIIRQDRLPNCEIAIADEPCVEIGKGWAGIGSTTFSQAANVDESATRGIEIAANWKIIDSLSLRGNYTYTDSEVKSGRDTGLPLVNTPKNMYNLTLAWQPLDDLSVSLISEIRSNRYRGTANVSGPQGPETQKLYYKAYDLYHLAATYKVNDSLAINARINNLLDDDLSSRSCLLAATEDEYECTSDYNTTQKARSFWVSMSYSF